MSSPLVIRTPCQILGCWAFTCSPNSNYNHRSTDMHKLLAIFGVLWQWWPMKYVKIWNLLKKTLGSACIASILQHTRPDGKLRRKQLKCTQDLIFEIKICCNNLLKETFCPCSKPYLKTPTPQNPHKIWWWHLTRHSARSPLTPRGCFGWLANIHQRGQHRRFICDCTIIHDSCCCLRTKWWACRLGDQHKLLIFWCTSQNLKQAMWWHLPMNTTAIIEILGPNSSGNFPLQGTCGRSGGTLRPKGSATVLNLGTQLLYFLHYRFSRLPGCHWSNGHKIQEWGHVRLCPQTKPQQNLNLVTP